MSLGIADCEECRRFAAMVGPARPTMFGPCHGRDRHRLRTFEMVLVPRVFYIQQTDLVVQQLLRLLCI